MTWKHFPHYWPFCPIGSVMENFDVFTCYPAQVFEQIVDLPVIWDAMTHITPL